MYIKIILFTVILVSNSLLAQDIKPSKELQGKWINNDFEIEINETALIIKNKKSDKAKVITLTFLETPKTNKINEFESWSCTGKFNANVVKQGNVEVKEDLNEYIYFRVKQKKERLVFDFSNSLYSNNFNPSYRLVPENIKKIYGEHGFFNNTLKLEKSKE